MMSVNNQNKSCNLNTWHWNQISMIFVVDRTSELIIQGIMVAKGKISLIQYFKAYFIWHLVKVYIN